MVHGYLPFSGRCSCPDAGLFVRGLGHGSCLRLLQGRDSLGDVLRIILHPADQSGAARVLPRETEEVETRDVGYPATVAKPSTLVKGRQIDPGVVGPIPGRPDDR